MTRTLERKIGRMCFVGFEGLTPPGYLLDWIRAGRVGGVILFTRNIDSPEQVIALTDALQAAAGPEGLVISIDQEGGAIARLHADKGFSEVPGAMALAAAQEGERHAERVAGILGAELRALGIHWNYAPCVDLFYNAGNPSLGTRSFGDEPERAGRLAAAVVRGLQSQGVAACAKHFPGLGSTALDTHIDLPIDDRSLDWLLATDLEPYRRVIDTGILSVMVTHTLISALDAALPATLSPVVVQRLLREELGFDGVVSTDCLEMGAITRHFTPGETTVLVALAGIDAILFSHTPARQAEAYDALLNAAQSGRLPMAIIDAANRRLDAFRAAILKPRGDRGVIRSAAHLHDARTAARAGVALVKGDAGIAGGLLHGRVGVVEFPSSLESGIVEQGGLTGFARQMRQFAPETDLLVWRAADQEAALALAARCDTLIVATRGAHLDEARVDAARQILRASRRSVLAALRSPFDAELFMDDAGAILCTFGDAEPQLAALVEVLVGQVVPSGRLPLEARAR
ncbi:MAG: beta-N-acetylhexosaminidase [Anaerolineae bacterium]|nr:beta-N-acetylhexosaminidase [Anaerolineae bacterium]NUQ04829.1 beta-N-acetylhexosaminidase [Anaerolineae bacterium]